MKFLEEMTTPQLATLKKLYSILFWVAVGSGVLDILVLCFAWNKPLLIAFCVNTISVFGCNFAVLYIDKELKERE